MTNYKDKYLEHSDAYASAIFWHGLFIWSLAIVFYFFDNLLNVSPSAMKPELMHAFAHTAADLGSLSACYLWAYGLMQIPAGMLLDHFGPRKLLSLASVLCALGSFMFGTAETLIVAKVARVFIGSGAAFAFVGCAKIVSVWFAPRRFAFFLGIMVSIGFSGAAFGLATVSWIIEHFEWRTSMLFASGFAFILSIFLFLLIKDHPDKPIFVCKHKIKETPIFTGIIEVMRSSQAWIASIYAALMFVPTLAFGALWGTPFLVEAHHYSRTEAGQIVSLIFIGWAVGAPIFGYISDHIGRRNVPMIFSNIATIIICIIIIYITNSPVWVMGTLMFLLGALSSGFTVAFAVIRESNRSEIAGTAIGFMNMLNTFGGAFLQYFIGELLDLTSNDSVVTSAGDKIFTLGDYQGALLSLPISLVISLIMLFFIKETYCKPKH